MSVDPPTSGEPRKNRNPLETRLFNMDPAYYDEERPVSHHSHQASAVFPTHGLYLGEKFIFFSNPSQRWAPSPTDMVPCKATICSHLERENRISLKSCAHIDFHPLSLSLSLSLSQTHLTMSVHSPLPLSAHSNSNHDHVRLEGLLLDSPHREAYWPDALYNQSGVLRIKPE